jgi:hypothetical protein
LSFSSRVIQIPELAKVVDDDGGVDGQVTWVLLWTVRTLIFDLWSGCIESNSAVLFFSSPLAASFIVWLEQFCWRDFSFSLTLNRMRD